MSDHNDESFFGGIFSLIIDLLVWLYLILAFVLLFSWVTRAIAWVLGLILLRPVAKLYLWAAQIPVFVMALWVGSEGADFGWIVALVVILEVVAVVSYEDVPENAWSRRRRRLFR